MSTKVLGIVLLCLFGLVYPQERKIKAILNPGCKPEWYYSTTLVHVTADSENDTLHHIWDFSSKPSILVARTPLNSTLTIDWENFLWNGGEGAVVLSPKPSYMFSVIFDKIIEFIDSNNTAKLENNYQNTTKVFNAENFNWSLVGIDNSSEKRASIIVEGKNSTLKNGSIIFKLETFGTKNHDDMLPHLFHTTNATEITVILDQLETSQPKSRFALNLVTASTDPVNTTLMTRKHKSLDDEHSPGIFTVSEVMSPGGNGTKELSKGYLQWRAVAYTSQDRAMTNTTDIIDYSFQPTTPAETNQTVVYSIYGYQLETMAINNFNVSFGTQDDGYYRKSNFISWTLLCGLGHPAEEEFSYVVLLVLAISIGLPFILIILGIFFYICKRVSRNRDDLVLSQ